ncbi:hypothetical protein MTO96_031237 [Rhipicephalus appendiculatus]
MVLVVRAAGAEGTDLELVVQMVVGMVYPVLKVVEEPVVLEVLVVLEESLVSERVVDQWVLGGRGGGPCGDTKLRLVVASDVGVSPHNQALQGSHRHRAQVVVVPRVAELVQVLWVLEVVGRPGLEVALVMAVELGLEQAVGLVVVLVQRVALSVLLGEVVQETVAQETDRGKAWVVVLGLVV